MSSEANRTDPALWERVKTAVTGGSKGGRAGQWSARKAQLATAEYKKQGGGYVGPKPADNHLAQWTAEDWGTRSGDPSGETGERYLPKQALGALDPDEYDRSTDKKRADTRKGRQFSPQPRDVAEKTARIRHEGDLSGQTRPQLLERATDAGVRGRSRMTKAALIKALS